MSHILSYLVLQPGYSLEKTVFLCLGHAQWENISITSMEVDFFGVKSSGCENSHATEVKSSILRKAEFHTAKEAK
jgi:hypothetical protein